MKNSRTRLDVYCMHLFESTDANKARCRNHGVKINSPVAQTVDYSKGLYNNYLEGGGGSKINRGGGGLNLNQSAG